jgi:uncharacterized protein
MYIEQFNNSKFKILTYLPFPLIFFGLMILNYLALKILKLDMNLIIKQEIERKGVNQFFIDSLIPFVIGLLLLFLWVKYVQKISLINFTTSRNKIDWNRIAFVFFIWGCFQVITTIISFYISPQNYIWNFNLEKFIPFALIAIILVPIQTSFEEYLFRAHIMQGLGVLSKNKLVPLVFSSVFFGLMHIANPEVEKLGNIILFYYISTGFFLGIITLMDDGLELALGFHAANNLITALLVTSDWTAFQTHSILKDVSDPSAGFEIVLPVFIVFPLLLLVFAKKYGWTDWKGKLAGKIIPPDNV